MKTEITELLGIEYPVVQGGMAWVAEANLAAAVSNAGGLGLIAAAAAPAEWVREQIKKVREMTDRPFGVNIMLMSPEADQVAKVIVEEKVPIVTTGAGSPEKYMADWKAAGVKVIPVVASTALARRSCGRGNRSRRPYWRDHYNDIGTSGSRCSVDSGDRCRGYRRWKRNGSSLYAGSGRRAGWHCFCGFPGICDPPEL